MSCAQTSKIRPQEGNTPNRKAVSFNAFDCDDFCLVKSFADLKPRTRKSACRFELPNQTGSTGVAQVLKIGVCFHCACAAFLATKFDTSPRHRLREDLRDVSVVISEAGLTLSAISFV